jgi:uncharacterized protein (TIGR01777 family)
MEGQSLSSFKITLNIFIMKNQKIIIAGGTGFIGQELAKWFAAENEIVILTRNVHEANNGYKLQAGAVVTSNIRYVVWDGKTLGNWANELEGAHLVINLAGKSVNCRYTAKNKRQIFDSRTEPTAILGEAIRKLVVPPKLWINAASATIYRHAEDRPQDELTGEIQNDFSVQVCKLWEKTFFDQRTPFTRKIALRMAVTLGVGGVMVPYLNLVKFGLGGQQGNGRQMFSWVHIHDICRTIEWCESHPDMEGVYNCCAPNPVTNQVFMKTLRQLTGHKIGLPAYTWMLKIGAFIIGTETELLLKSRWVLATKLEATGFEFRFQHIEQAFAQIIGSIPANRYLKTQQEPNSKQS